MGKGPWFPAASALAAAGLLASLAFLPGPARWWAAGAWVAAYLAVTGLGVYWPGMNYFCRALRRGRPGMRRIALTFDDGPDPRVTPLLLDLLQKHRAHASFFCVGERAEANAPLLKRIVEEGHTLGNHSNAHRWWTNFLLKEPLVREINRGQEVLGRLSGRLPRYYRSPMGLSNPHLGPALRETGLTLVAWNVRTFDRHAPVRAIVGRVAGWGKGKAPARDGSIVLLHDGEVVPENLLPAVEQIIGRFQVLGYSFVSLDELFGNGGEVD